MLKNLLEQNVKWATDKVRNDPDYFSRLTDLQNPEYFWIGCSDSRVPANVITGLAPGEVFVHRNVSNLAHPADLNYLSVLQFAVEVLKVRHIIVCGHYGCGGIKAATDGKRHGLIDHWLQPIRDTAEQRHADLHGLTGARKLDRLCELSVESQVMSVCRTPIVQDAWKNGQSLHVHGWVYALRDGLIRNMHCSRDASGRIDDPSIVAAQR